jgi:uncharacterized delta-60 repeat protein
MAQMMRIPQMKQWFSIRVIRLIRAIRVRNSSYSRHSCSLFFAVCAILLCAGCIKGPDFPFVLSPRVIVQTPSNPSSGNIAISFQLIDREKEPGNIILEYSINGGTFNPAALVDSSETQNLQSDWYPGIAHTVRWNSVTDMVGISGNASVIVKVTPSDATNPSGGTSDVSRTFTVNNIEFNQPPGVNITTPTGAQFGNIPINYSLSDVESDTCSIVVDYSTDDGANWQTATMGWAGDGQTGLSSSPLPGTMHIFLWDSRADSIAPDGQEDDIKIRITPSDFHTGNPAETNSFSVDNTLVNNPPTVDITRGPEEGSTVYANQVTFEWESSDTDGTVLGYYYSFDRDPPNIWTTETSVTSGILSGGTHIFRLVAVDDCNAFSTPIVRTFTVVILPPVADFTATPTSGAVPLTVQFTDTSTGVITSWAWDFDNDGMTDSTEQNPDYTYTNPGAYTVKLTVTGPAGSDQEVKANYITVFETPFVKTWGGSDTDILYEVVVDSGGNVYCAGHTRSFGAGWEDTLLLKYNSSWSLQWAKTWGGSGAYDMLNGVAIDSGGNIYCAGSTASFGAGSVDAALLKYNNSGTLQWAKTWGRSGDWDYLYAVALDSGGNIYCAGWGSFGAGDDALLLKYDSSGALQWAKTWGGSYDDELRAVAVDSAGNIYCAGYTESFGAGGDALLLEYDSSGTLKWAKTWGGSNPDYLSAVTVDSAGNIYCAGSTNSFGAGSNDALLLKYDSSGTVQLAKTWGGSASDYLSAVTVDSAGNIYCAGSTNSFGAGSNDALLLKYNSSGTLQWAKTWGGSASDWLSAVVVDSTRNVYLGGYTGSYTGVWQAQTGSQTSPAGTSTTPSGTVGSPSATQTSPSGTQTSPTGSETGAGGLDTLLLKNW